VTNAREFQAPPRTGFGTSCDEDGAGRLTVEIASPVNRVSSSNGDRRPIHRSHNRSETWGAIQEAVGRDDGGANRQATELTRGWCAIFRAARQGAESARRRGRLTGPSRSERKLWVFVVALVLAGFSCHATPSNRCTAAGADLVTAAGGSAPAICARLPPGNAPGVPRAGGRHPAYGRRVRQIVGAVIGESDRIAGGPGHVGGEREARRLLERVSTPWWRSRRRGPQRAALTSMGSGLELLRTRPARDAERRSAPSELGGRSARLPPAPGDDGTAPALCCSTGERGSRPPRSSIKPVGELSVSDRRLRGAHQAHLSRRPTCWH